jgi:hypothetical protein
LYRYGKKFDPNDKQLKYFLPKKLLLSPQKYELGIRDTRSGIRDPKELIPDTGFRVKKAPDPQYCHQHVLTWQPVFLSVFILALLILCLLVISCTVLYGTVPIQKYRLIFGSYIIEEHGKTYNTQRFVNTVQLYL